MKTLKRIKGSKVGKKLSTIIELHNNMKGCYFWSPPGTASGRRYYETQRCNKLSFIYDGALYEINQSTDCSCKNIYYSLSVMVDGKSKDVRAIKKLVA